MIIATVNQNINRVIKETLPIACEADEVIVCHQIFDGKTKNRYNNKWPDNVAYIMQHNKGVSRNRNAGIQYASGDITLICDDDVILYKGFSNTIKDTYKYYDYWLNRKDLITFELDNPNGKKSKTYPIKGNHNTKTVMRMGGPNISFLTSKVKEKDIMFDPMFGFSDYISGEDNIFLHDCLKSNLIMYHEDKSIGSIPKGSSWKMWSYKNIKDKGAVFYRMFGFLGLAINILFAFIKRREHKKNVIKVTIEMMKGSLDYRRRNNAKKN